MIKTILETQILMVIKQHTFKEYSITKGGLDTFLFQYTTEKHPKRCACFQKIGKSVSLKIVICWWTICKIKHIFEQIFHSFLDEL